MYELSLLKVIENLRLMFQLKCLTKYSLILFTIHGYNIYLNVKAHNIWPQRKLSSRLTIDFEVKTWKN